MTLKPARPSILLGIICLTLLTAFMAWLGFEPLAGAGIGGLVVLLPKILESEEATMSKKPPDTL